jgi:hypothetical protein
MGLSRKLKDKISALSESELDRLVRMGWEDRTSRQSVDGITKGWK